MNKPIEKLLKDQAADQGYRPLAGPYTTEEAWMMWNVIADMSRGNIPFVIVDEDGGESVWSK